MDLSFDGSRTRRPGAAWSAALARAFPGAHVTPAPGFDRARIRSTSLGTVSVHDVEAGAQRVDHRPTGRPLRLLSVMVQLEGSVAIGSAGRETELRPGELLLADIDQPLHLRSTQPFRQVFVLVPFALVGALPEAAFGRATSRDSATDRLLADYVRTLVAAGPGLDDRGRRLASEALLPLVRLATPVTVRANAGTRLQRALLYIDEHLGEAGLSAADIASAQRVSRRLLDDHFRAVGTTIERALWTRRLERAAALLRDPSRADESVLSVALDCGFKDASHFARMFRRQFGVTPSGFRRT